MCRDEIAALGRLHVFTSQSHFLVRYCMYVQILAADLDAYLNNARRLPNTTRIPVVTVSVFRYLNRFSNIENTAGNFASRAKQKFAKPQTDFS